MLRRIARVFLVLFVIFIAILLFIRSPWGQNIIVSKVTDYISSKTNTKIEIDRLFLTFSGNLSLEGLYLEDTKRDSLLYSKALEANLSIFPILFGNELTIKSLQWEGLTAHISREADSEKFNFNFLLEAFALQDTVPSSPATEPMRINIGSLDFSDFKIDYNDKYLGIETRLRLGKLFLDAKTTDLETMHFELKDLKLSDTHIFYKQTKPFVSEDTTKTQLPYLAVDHLELKNVVANYNSIPNDIHANANLTDFLLELPKADLVNKDFEIGTLFLKDSKFAIQLPRQNGGMKDSTAVVSTDFEWPGFVVKIDNIDFQNNSATYQSGESKIEKKKLDPDAISLSKLTFQAKNIAYRPKKMKLELTQLSFAEKSGFQLRDFAFDANMDNTSASVSALKLRTNNSSVVGNLSLEYPSVEVLIASPKKAAIALNMPSMHLALSDIFMFQPDLANNEYIEKVAQNPIIGNLKANGTLAAIEIPDLNLDWGEHTSLIAQGRLNNVTETDSLSFDFNTLKAISDRNDLLQFISERQLGISIPETVEVDARAKGSLNNITADVLLKIPEGSAHINGNYRNKDQIAFDGNLKVDSLQLGKIIKNDQIGNIAFTMDISGNGKSINTLNAELKSDFSQLDLKNYDFSNLGLKGKISNGNGNIDLNFKDRNLNFTANTKVFLDSIASEFKLDLNLVGADLYAMGITKENIKVGLAMKADFSGDSDDYKMNAHISNGIAVYDNQQYQMGDIDLVANIDTVSTDVTINSDFLVGSLKSNASPKAIDSALTKQFKSYFSGTSEALSETDSVKLKMEVKLHPNPILSEVFFRDIDRLDSILLKADFDATAKKLNAELSIPFAMYHGRSVDSLNILVTGNSTDLNFTAGLANLLADPIHIKKTYFEGNLKKRVLLLDFLSFDGEEKLVHIASEMTLANDTTQLHINPTGLILNKREWSIPDDNKITISKNFLEFNNINLKRNAQELKVNNTVDSDEKKHIGITFDDFKLQTFLSLLNPDESLASGLVKGNLVIKNPYGATGILANFKIKDFKVMQNPLGNLTMDATSKTKTSYDFNLALKDGGADLDLKGDYTALKTGAQLNLDLDLNRIEMKVIEGFTNDALKDSHGSLSGKITVSGTPTSPKYNGNISFDGTNFKVATLNSVFKISGETLKIDTHGVYFNNFQITDAKGGNFNLGGSILTKDLLNPSFDLKLDAENFLAINSSKKDNELFYGKASLDADITVKGDLELPKIDGKLRIRKITDVTYVVPESQMEVEERDGVVIFVNREDPDAILTRKDQEKTPSFFKGMDVKAVLEIADDADFHIIIDKRTGDNLEVSGDAALNLSIEPNGRINLSGRYELNSGHYETSLYNLVKRRFEINPGSTITWVGDPTEAKLDVTAVYKVATSAAPLMSTVTSGQDISVTGKYRQVLPFLVYLNVDGQLLEPKLSFGLDMPENEQGSLGGAVYGRVQQLNQQEAELNKQVFSLLALNRFYPDSGSDGSAGGTAAIARDNANKVLSGELNAFSDKIFGKTGFEVDFDLDSFTDYQGESPQDRTQLNINAKKKLFNDRLIVTAGSAVDVEGSAQPGQDETPIIGNVSLEYLLTKDGRYRLRGFRKSAYENIIDGQLIVTGVALIFNREFNKFSQLFNPLKDKDASNTKGNKENKKENE